MLSTEITMNFMPHAQANTQTRTLASIDRHIATQCYISLYTSLFENTINYENYLSVLHFSWHIVYKKKIYETEQ